MFLFTGCVSVLFIEINNVQFFLLIIELLVGFYFTLVIRFT